MVHAFGAHALFSHLMAGTMLFSLAYTIREENVRPYGYLWTLSVLSIICMLTYVREIVIDGRTYSHTHSTVSSR